MPRPKPPPYSAQRRSQPRHQPVFSNPSAFQHWSSDRASPRTTPPASLPPAARPAPPTGRTPRPDRPRPTRVNTCHNENPSCGPASRSTASSAPPAALQRRPRLRERLRRILEPGNSRTAPLPRPALRARRDERLAIAHLKRHPPHRDAQQSVTVLVDIQRVLAAQIHRARRGRIHHELARRRPDKGVQLAATQFQPLAARRQHFDFPAPGPRAPLPPPPAAPPRPPCAPPARGAVSRHPSATPCPPRVAPHTAPLRAPPPPPPPPPPSAKSHARAAGCARDRPAPPPEPQRRQRPLQPLDLRSGGPERSHK